MAVASWQNACSVLRHRWSFPYSCKVAIVPLFLSWYIYRLWPSRCKINTSGGSKKREEEEDYTRGLRVILQKKDLFSKRLCSSVKTLLTMCWKMRTGCVLYHRFWMLKKTMKINVCNVKQRRIFLRDLTFIRRLYL